jgi:hypothetical protein
MYCWASEKWHLVFRIRWTAIPANAWATPQAAAWSPFLSYPTANNTLAWKNKGMKPVFVDDGQFKIAPEAGCYYWLPHFQTFDVKLTIGRCSEFRL